MAQYAILIYAQDSAHALDATPQDTEACDEHSDDLAESGSMLAAYALTPRTWPRPSAVTPSPTAVRGRQGDRGRLLRDRGA